MTETRVEPLRLGAHRQLNVMVPMRDGTRLATDLFFPNTPGEPRPVLLSRTPYGKLLRRPDWHRYLAAGYVLAVQDVRGRHDSDGEFYPVMNEGLDGYDTIEWLAAQPWCNGRVGTMGGSYSGWVQWAAARERPAHLQAMAVSVTAGKFGRQEMWDHGVFMLTALNWLVLTGGGRVLQETWMSDWRAAYEHLPMIEMPQVLGRDLPAWRDWMDHPGLDDYWKSVCYEEADFASVDLPVLHVTGWFDGNLPATVWFYEQMRRHSPASNRQALIVGPWDHLGAGDDQSPREFDGHDFGSEAAVDLTALRLRWFDRWLRDDEGAADIDTRVFVTGVDRWLEAPDWPNSRASVWHLHSDGTANGHLGGGRLDLAAPVAEPADTYRYDPLKPIVLYENWDLYGHVTNDQVPTREPVRDMTRLVGREDVLAYTSEGLEEDLETGGTPQVSLWASTDGPDTDWFVWLHDVCPDGSSIEVSRGHLRARFHESLARESFLEPGQPYEFRITLHPLAHRFHRGHALRLVVGSSNFPRYDRNLNSGEALGYGTRPRVATNTVLHDTLHPSHVVLPVVP